MFCDAFPDNKVKNRPYDVLFGEGDFTCFVTRFTGTFTAPLKQPDGSVIEPTGKSFDVLYSTAAKWRDGRIIEEYLFYDNGTFLSNRPCLTNRDAALGGVSASVVARRPSARSARRVGSEVGLVDGHVRGWRDRRSGDLGIAVARVGAERVARHRERAVGIAVDEHRLHASSPAAARPAM